MKKIKILNYLVILLFMVNVIWFVQHFIFSIKVINDDVLISMVENIVFKHYKFFIDLSFSFIFLIGLYFIQRGLNSIVRNGFFYNTSKSLLRKGGLFFIISGFLGSLFNIIIPLFKGVDFFKMFLGNDFLVFVLGLSLFFVSDIIKEGNLLKKENDLTI